MVMKSIFLFCIFIFGSFSLTSQNQKRWMVSKNEPTKSIKHVTVAEILDKDFVHFSNVIVDGQLTYRTTERNFAFSDSTGDILIDLTKSAEYKLRNQIVLGSEVRILAVVKKRFWGADLLEIVNIKSLKPSILVDF